MLIHDQKKLAKGEFRCLACEALDGVCQIDIFQIRAIDAIILELQPWPVKSTEDCTCLGRGCGSSKILCRIDAISDCTLLYVSSVKPTSGLGAFGEYSQGSQAESGLFCGSTLSDLSRNVSASAPCDSRALTSSLRSSCEVRLLISMA